MLAPLLKIQFCRSKQTGTWVLILFLSNKLFSEWRGRTKTIFLLEGVGTPYTSSNIKRRSSCFSNTIIFSYEKAFLLFTIEPCIFSLRLGNYPEQRLNCCNYQDSLVCPPTMKHLCRFALSSANLDKRRSAENVPRTSKGPFLYQYHVVTNI